MYAIRLDRRRSGSQKTSINLRIRRHNRKNQFSIYYWILERSRQSARECRARKKLRYQYLEEIISETEKSIFALRREMDMMKIWAKELDDGRLPENLVQYRNSCVEKKLTSPFKLQQHQQVQIAQQRQQAAEVAAAGQFSHSPNSASALGSGGGCVSPSTSMTLGTGMAALSVSPTAHVTPYMTMSLGKRSMHSSPSASASASHSSVSPP